MTPLVRTHLFLIRWIYSPSHRPSPEGRGRTADSLAALVRRLDLTKVGVRGSLPLGERAGVRGNAISDSPPRRNRSGVSTHTLIHRFGIISLFVVLLIAGDPWAHAAPTQWAPLFPSDGFPSGWTVRAWNDVSKPGPTGALWRVEHGVLTGSAERGSWLMSEREFADFELEFDFKLGPLGNSGCALRAPMSGDPAFDGMELQMADYRYNTNAKPSELTGGIYRAIAPTKQVYKPTEWNHYRISLKGTRLVAVLNGEKIHDLDLSTQSPEVKRHDGTPAVPVKDRPRRGHIGFQNLSRGTDPVLIRNARLRVLDE